MLLSRNILPSAGASTAKEFGFQGSSSHNFRRIADWNVLIFLKAAMTYLPLWAPFARVRSIRININF
jgi:hypothetical protein